ncbi:MAG: 30S ribosomal protein S5 [Phycisphaeraceae bacterium]|nr:30S ribosomal protein S5 [Phycisphaeraceae bacterium]MBX3408972.1 30S ribosomal protein S5 [Phycisphaeraceae bacterium]
MEQAKKQVVEVIDEGAHVESSNIGVDRTSTTVKGGRRFSFGALIVVGDRRGRVGFGYGKSNEVPAAIEKAEKYAKRSMISVPLLGSTIPHEVEGKYSASKVRLIPAAPGTGVVAGGTVRTILEKAGITDCLTKCYGSTNKRNVVKAVFDGLSRLRMSGRISSARGLDLGLTEIENKIERGKRFMPAVSARKDRVKGPVNTVDDHSRKGGRGRGGPRRRNVDTQPADQPAPPAADASASNA